MRKHRKAALAACLLAVLVGLGMVLCPIVKRLRTETEVAAAAKDFLSTAPTADREGSFLPGVSEAEAATPYPELLAAMEAYNRKIFREEQAGLSEVMSYQVPGLDLEAYGIEDGIVGVLSIPRLEQEFPIYLGATAEHMASGVAQMTETSMPIGGDNTNCVFAGHRGWNGAPFLRYIERLEIGDQITITNLWGVLTYEVTEIQIIEPDDMDAILIRPGRDMVTILTCHPYNSGGRYRYLVFCDRVVDTE